MFNRIDDISTIEHASVEAILARGECPIIQFSAPGYTPRLLRQIDRLCVSLGPKLEVRFYGHYETGFDAQCLALLPNVASLSVDCLTTVKNIETLFGLRRLQRLSLGVHDLGRPDILAHLAVEALAELFLGETRGAEIDLSPLARCRAMNRLHVAGHIRGFDTLAALSSVAELSLRSIPKKQSLAVVSRMSGLRALSIILGGRTNIDEIEHPELTRLSVEWVRAFETVGSLGRFPPDATTTRDGSTSTSFNRTSHGVPGIEACFDF